MRLWELSLWETVGTTPRSISDQSGWEAWPKPLKGGGCPEDEEEGAMSVRRKKKVMIPMKMK